MKSRVALLLADGFEEAEAIIILDILERVNVSVTTLACKDERVLSSYHNVTVTANALLAHHMETLFDAVILPGGPQGTINLAENQDVIDFIRKHDEKGKWICPICSAAARVLAPHKLLKGRRYVCSGTLSETVTDGIYVDAPVVEDGNLISGQGLGASFDFAFYLGLRLTGDEAKVQRQAKHIYHKLIEQ
ncbi:DJ-1/PfpI family protein [Pectobacterium polonicum]|uniref:DJ-1/PfpI family protein n=1 Tax=Pectobacterium polonicum TaxID=2485124 RepID=A0AAE9NQU9_9GAMM|nr:DJ-1/PfpI family protein [Pectobacterium polonicum]TKY80281.1 DJ-1/PfpI family protein [Pectobacterium polonicum]UVO08118.1 DJ-1/PfpI family protein [Pectobacterium polonicum]